MATRTTVTLVDDLDGTVAEQSVSFGLDRVYYEIDLSEGHARTLREVLAPFTAAARRTGGPRVSAGRRPLRDQPANGAAGRSRAANSEIRAWAAQHDVTLAERGRIPSRVIEAFEAGDPSRLPAGGTATPAASPTSSAESSSPNAMADAPAQAEAPRGRDGLTAEERETIRGWAVDQGIEVKTRGILKKDLISNYQAWRSR